MHEGLVIFFVISTRYLGEILLLCCSLFIVMWRLEWVLVNRISRWGMPGVDRL